VVEGRIPSAAYRGSPAPAGFLRLRVCNAGSGEAPGIWSPIQGYVGDDFSLALYLTSLRVARVKLRVKQRGGGSSVRMLATRRLSREQSDRARVRRDFRYVVVTSRGEGCVVAVTAYNSAKERLGHKNLPCEI